MRGRKGRKTTEGSRMGVDWRRERMEGKGMKDKGGEETGSLRACENEPVEFCSTF